ncbi:angio-associated migratory cell protein-like [Hibiscus syriacus]|uniref:Angio-associated migratory cell protein-like n=1 Tax=Hibiscus syriacus TaxID=106335 RepID=A0A6A3AS09_HIBSY|nr:putative GATA transcription factor 22 [Hibiscus syriacus]KAE8705885.1 angio-associated migratory cell protein-like [Hibiscus syriacus]
MTSSNCYSSLYPFPLDLNEDDQHQQHHLFTLKSQPSSSSSSSLTCPTFFNPTVQNQAGSCQRESQEFLDQQDQAKIYVPQDGQLWSGGDSGVKLSIWKKEERIESDDHHHEDSSYKWMPSKMRILRKMMTSEQSDLSKSSTAMKFEDLKVQINQPSSSPDNSSNSSYNNNNNNSPIRVCADCNTIKTPLWRSGPRGPKSLCNACGIRQRKARRAMAAAANGTIVGAETTTSAKSSKVKTKAKRTSIGRMAKLKNTKMCKLSSQSQGRRKKLCFEDLRVILSKNSAFHRVFPQDEKEAAILLMALSYGLVHD